MGYPQPYFADRPRRRRFFFGGMAVWIAIECRQGFHRRPDATRADGGSALVLRAVRDHRLLLAALAGGRLMSAALSLRRSPSAFRLLIVWAGISGWLVVLPDPGADYFTSPVMTSPEPAGDHLRPLPRRPPSQLLWPAPDPVPGHRRHVRELDHLAAVIVFSVAGIAYRIHVEETALSTTSWPGVPVLRRRPRSA